MPLCDEAHCKASRDGSVDEASEVDCVAEGALFGDLGKRAIGWWAWAGRILRGTVVVGRHSGDRYGEVAF